MSTLERRLSRLEKQSQAKPIPRIVVLDPGESKEAALVRLGLVTNLLEMEARQGRQLIFVRWAG